MNAQAKPKENTVLLWHPDGDCQIALTNGHILIVKGDPAGTPVPRMFRREAIARGCIPVGLAREDLDPEESGGFDRPAHLKKVMQQMLESDDPSMFTQDGKPSLAKLSDLAGFTVERAERDAVWTQLENDIDADEKEKAAAGGGKTVKATETVKGGSK